MSPDELGEARELLEAFRLPLATARFRGRTFCLSALKAAIDGALERDCYFPADLRPEDLGDGALIERVSPHRYRVHERWEVGQLRFSELSARSYFFLRGAVLRYLGHYRALLRVHQVTIRRWS